MEKAIAISSILKLFVFATVMLFCTNLQAQVEVRKNGLTKVSGQILFTTSKTIGIKFYSDFISRGEEVYDIPIVENKFSITFQLNYSTPIFLVYDGEEIPLYLDPGDNLYVNAQGNDFSRSITFAGQGAGKSRYLKNLRNVFSERNSDDVFYELVERDPMDFRRYMDRLYQKVLNFHLNLNYQIKKDFSAEFEEYIRADIDYWYAYNLLRYRVEHPLSNGISDPIELPADYYSFLDEIMISNENALSNANYLFFLDQYLAFRNHLLDTDSDVSFLSNNFKVSVSSMLIFKEPNSPPILAEVKKGSPLKYSGKRTDYTSDIQIKGEIKNDYWYQVTTNQGHIGWVHGAGVQKESLENNSMQSKLSFSSDSKLKNVYQFFSGKPLYHILANDLYWNLSNLTPLKREERINDFIAINPYQNYDSILYYSFYQNLEIPPSAEAIIKIAQDINFQSIDGAVKILANNPKENLIGPPAPVKLETSRENLIAEKGATSRTESPKNNIKIPARKYAASDYVSIDPRPAKRSTKLSSISGRIDFPSGVKPSLLIYSDPITFQEIIHEFEVNEMNTFELSLNLAEPAIGVFRYGKQEVPLYLEPGDLMQIKFSGKNFLHSLQFAGKGAAHNNYLKEQTLRFSRMEKDARKQAEFLSEHRYTQLMDKIKLEKNGFLKSSRFAAQFSERFKVFAQADIDYWYAYLRLNYPWEYGFANGMDGPMKMPKSYFKFLQELSVSAEGVLPNANYAYFLDQFIEYQSEQVENKKLTDHQLIEKYLSGEPAAYFLAKKYSIACKRGKAKMEGQNIKSFIEDNPYEIYNDVLRLVYNEAKGLEVGMMAPNFTLKDVQGKEISLHDLKGKVVYLDFWATWCSPCLMQMKNSKSWKSKFQNEEVVFLYLSLDKNKTTWENFVKNNKTKDLHLIASGGDVYKSQVAKLYKVKKLPTYFLIDKNGRIAFQPERGQNITRVEEKIIELLRE